MLIRLSRTSATVLFLLVMCCGAQSAFGSPIDRVEPPFWWQGFEHKELQVMIHGHDTARFDVSVAYPGITVARVERVESENYLFVYLNIDTNAKPGEFDIVLDADDVRVTHAYELREKNPDPSHTRGFSPADAIYLITPDRFANGDPTNDSVDGYGDPVDRSNDYGRHGGDLAGLRKSLNYIDDMGYTAIWINPILENAMPEASYHGYATTDYYKVDPRFGSNDEYREFVAAAKIKGLGVIMDMITNHIGSEHWWMHDVPNPDWFNFLNDYHQTSSAKATIFDPYASEYDKKIYFDGWYVPTMPDLNQRNPLLADYLTQNAIWWVEYLGLAGIRLDTYSFSDKDFLSEWTRRIMQEFPNFNITGEETVKDPALGAYWQRGNENHDGYVSWLPSLLDFPLYHAMNESLTKKVAWWDSPWTSTYEAIATDFVYPDPTNLVIFPDNHDQSRIYTKVGEDYDLYRMAMVYYLTMRGIPQIFYGTEVLMSHPRDDGNHGEIRAEFPGGWDDHEKNAFTGEGLTDDERRAQDFMRKLLNWRRDKAVIHSGKLMQFTPMRHVFAYFRYDDSETVMVVFNRGKEPVTLELDRFSERLGDSQIATDVITGKRINIGSTMNLEPMSVMILEVE
jgi:glycosidase